MPTNSMALPVGNHIRQIIHKLASKVHREKNQGKSFI
jgi:hypothetical protein